MKQQLKAILDDDRGVSPVIGVILMVAITVILAAVIGAFVLNLGGDLEQAPQAQLSVEVNDAANGVILTHNGGDALNVDDLRIAGDLSTGPFTGLSGYASGDQFSVGDEAQLGGSSGNEYTVRIIHEPSDSILVEGTVSVPA